MRERNRQPFDSRRQAAAMAFTVPAANIIAKGPPLLVASDRQLRVGAVKERHGASGEQHVRYVVLEFSDPAGGRRWNPFRHLHQRGMAKLDRAVFRTLDLFTSPKRDAVAERA